MRTHFLRLEGIQWGFLSLGAEYFLSDGSSFLFHPQESFQAEGGQSMLGWPSDDARDSVAAKCVYWRFLLDWLMPGTYYIFLQLFCTILGFNSRLREAVSWTTHRHFSPESPPCSPLCVCKNKWSAFTASGKPFFSVSDRRKPPLSTWFSS